MHATSHLHFHSVLLFKVRKTCGRSTVIFIWYQSIYFSTSRWTIIYLLWIYHLFLLLIRPVHPLQLSKLVFVLMITIFFARSNKCCLRFMVMISMVFLMKLWLYQYDSSCPPQVRQWWSILSFVGIKNKIVLLLLGCCPLSIHIFFLDWLVFKLLILFGILCWGCFPPVQPPKSCISIVSYVPWWKQIF